ncbi:MFS transporter [Corynebacterium pseudotuberculosis]|uniref:MFS transporter n=1 Tax=Corynebacterium pseudotuberculosis TaxID=1719 RepID=UPI00059C0D22|nr:MFS transporter [Corynebacterium pseudotuberculosis]
MKSQQRWPFLGVISLGLFMIGADNSILYTALPVLRSQLHTTEVEGLWIINSYSLVLAGLLLGTGTLGDKIGHRRMFEIGISIFGLASLACSFAHTPLALIAARAALGVGAATMMPATLALLRITFPSVRERNIAIGIWGSVATLGAALGPVIGGFLIQHYYWGSVFLINIPVTIIAFIGTLFIAPPNAADPSRHWDFISSFWAMVSMMGLVLAIKEVAHRDLPVLIGALAAIALGALLFNQRQRTLADPLLTFDVFRNRVFTAGVLAAVLAMFILAGTELMTTQRFQLAEGFTPFQAGLLTGAVALAAFPSSILGGAFLHAIGFLPLISGGFLLMTLGTSIAVGSARADTFPLFIIGLLLIGFGAGLTMSVSSTAIIGSAPTRRSGMASAMEEVSYEVGTLLSVAIVGSLFSFFYTRSAPKAIGQNFEQGLSHPTLADAARNAIDTSYLSSLIIIAVIAGAACATTAYLLRDNPKETQFAHE